MNKKQSGIVLKLNGWMTQKSYAEKNNHRQVLVAQWVCRAKAAKIQGLNYNCPVDYLDVPELGLTLVRAKSDKIK